MFKPVTALALAATILIAMDSTILVTAEPARQNPTRTPTDEPTKPPYVFPTPIFIPTYVSATDLPPRTAPTPRPPGTVAGEQIYTVEPGDNPSLIAKKVYGDAGKFRLIVEANNLTDTTRLRIGTVLIIPPLTPLATLTIPPALATQLQTTPTLARAESPTPSPTPSAIFTPTPKPSSALDDVMDIARALLLTLSFIFFLGFLAAAILAFLLYRHAKRREKISFIKRRLKGE